MNAEERIAELLDLDEDGLVEWAKSYLKKRGFRVTSALAPPKQYPGQIRITDYDPETGELRSERFVQARDPQNRPL